jgi:hypothetical protein
MHPPWTAIASFLGVVLLLSAVVAWSNRTWARNTMAVVLVSTALLALLSFVSVGRSLRGMRLAVAPSEQYVEGVQDFLKATGPTQLTLLVTTLGLAILAFRRPPPR